MKREVLLGTNVLVGFAKKSLSSSKLIVVFASMQ